MFFGLCQQRQNAAGQPQQFFPLRRCDHLTASTIEQRAAKLLLKAADLLADGGLGQMDPFTGAGKAAGVDNGDKTAQ